MAKAHQPTFTWEVIVGVCATALLHAGMVGGYFYWYAQSAHAGVEAPAEELLHFEAAELLMWGEVTPDPHQLPTIANPAPEERPEEVVALQPPDEETVVVEQEPEDQPVQREEPEEEPERRDSTRHNENRPMNDQPLRGSDRGFRGGTSLSPTALANLFGPAQAQIQRAFNPPASIPREELDRLEARVLIFVNETGRIRRFSWRLRSGNRLFDSAAERALNTFRLGSQRLRLPRQNERAMSQVLADGLVIVITP